MIKELHTKRTIKTFSGKYIDVFAPNPEDITIEDIAQGLAQTCRWAGQSSRFISVATHSISTAGRVTDKHKLEALLHDATEAYLGDMPKPIKRYLPDYAALERTLDAAIRKKFGLPAEMSPEVKVADHEDLEHEWKNVKDNETFKEGDHSDLVKRFLSHFEIYKNA